MRLRIKFKKYGPVKFIGHLDVMRYFQKAIRRAEIDVVYTSGFSPHQVMTFAAPLGVGLESNGEYMDIEVASLVSCADVVNRLNAVSVYGIEVVSATILPEDAGNAMASVAAASYHVSFREGREPSFDVSRALQELMAKEHIIVTKTTKKGTRELDIKPGIFQISYENHAFHMLIDASSGGNIKPIQIISALYTSNNEEMKENALLITREDVYTNVGTSEEPNYVPLDAIGHAE